MPHIIHKASLNDPELDLFCRLTERQLRNKLEPEKGIFIAESLKVIKLALRCGVEPLALLLEEKWVRRLHDEIAALPESVPVYVLEPEQIEAVTGYNVTRGALMACRRPRPQDPQEILARAKRVAVLEDIRDSTNVGAVFRSAAALDVDAVLLSPECVEPLVRRAVRVSMGTVFQVPWAQFDKPWPQSVFDVLHDLGFTSAAMALSHDAYTLDDPALKRLNKLALFLGTEGDGLRAGTIAGCDLTVTIPMSHGVDSLNVAAASAVAFWELCRS